MCNFWGFGCIYIMPYVAVFGSYLGLWGVSVIGISTALPT